MILRQNRWAQEKERERHTQTDRKTSTTNHKTNYNSNFNLVFILIQSFRGSLLMILISWLLPNFWKTKQMDRKGTKERERKRERDRQTERQVQPSLFLDPIFQGISFDDFDKLLASKLLESASSRVIDDDVGILSVGDGPIEFAI
jgi:hypothetical protein